MDSKYPAGEWVVIVIALGIFFFYHCWFFCMKTGLLRAREDKYYGINGKGKLARVIFTHLVSTKKGGVLGIQQNRNTMMGASFQASIAALFFNELLDILVSPGKLRTLQRFAQVDPFLRRSDEADVDNEDIGFEYARIGRVTALAVIIINLAVILLAMLFFIVCVRICIHSGYYYKASAHQSHLIKVEDSLKLTLQTQMVYTIGQRLIFFFPITAMWFLGPTALLCTSVVITAGVAMLDRWDPKNPAMHVQGVLDYSPPPPASPPAATGPAAVSASPASDQVISATPARSPASAERLAGAHRMADTAAAVKPR
eukprot:jgi/Ulvmu1/5255/UM022_0048.1